MYYCLANFVFSDDRKYFLIEEFLFEILNNSIDCKYIYLSNEMTILYEKTFGFSSQTKVEKVAKQMEIEEKYQNIYGDDATAFHRSKRKYYDEYLSLIENKYNEFFRFCLKSEFFPGFILKSKFVKIEHFACFLHLKEQKIMIESGKNFGFDYLLYKEDANDKDLHLHAPFAVSILEEKPAISYTEILGKLRIAKNYGKVHKIFCFKNKIISILKGLVLLKVSKKNQLETKEECNLTLISIKERFIIKEIILK